MSKGKGRSLATVHPFFHIGRGGGELSRGKTKVMGMLNRVGKDETSSVGGEMGLKKTLY